MTKLDVAILEYIKEHRTDIYDSAKNVVCEAAEAMRSLGGDVDLDRIGIDVRMVSHTQLHGSMVEHFSFWTKIGQVNHQLAFGQTMEITIQAR